MSYLVIGFVAKDILLNSEHDDFNVNFIDDNRGGIENFYTLVVTFCQNFNISIRLQTGKLQFSSERDLYSEVCVI